MNSIKMRVKPSSLGLGWSGHFLFHHILHLSIEHFSRILRGHLSVTEDGIFLDIMLGALLHVIEPHLLVNLLTILSEGTKDPADCATGRNGKSSSVYAERASDSGISPAAATAPAARVATDRTGYQKRDRSSRFRPSCCCCCCHYDRLLVSSSIYIAYSHSILINVASTDNPAELTDI